MTRITVLAAIAALISIVAASAGATEPAPDATPVFELYHRDGLAKAPGSSARPPEKGDTVELVVTERDATTIRLHFRRKPAKGE